MGVRSAAVLALLRRCTAVLAMIPAEHTDALCLLGDVIRSGAEQEVLTSFALGDQVTRLPIEMHIFGEALKRQFHSGLRGEGRCIPKGSDVGPVTRTSSILRIE